MQKVATLNLSRRKFCLLSSAFVFSSILTTKNVLALDYIDFSLLLRGLMERIGIDSSLVRVGRWMHGVLLKKEVLEIMKKFEKKLLLTPEISKQDVSNLISNDYLQGCTVDISGIRFSVFEAALCLTASRYRLKSE